MKSTNIDIAVHGPIASGFEQILTDDALQFVAALARKFVPRIEELLVSRRERQQKIDNGQFPDFLEETAEIRASDWKVCDIPQDLSNRRVEITGPTDRKMIINALNSGADVFMADCEDSMTRLQPSNLGSSSGAVIFMRIPNYRIASFELRQLLQSI